MQGLLYFKITGVTDLRPAKQPFLNAISYLPFEVPPSAHIIRGG